MKILLQFAALAMAADVILTTTLAIIAPKLALALQDHILHLVHP